MKVAIFSNNYLPRISGVSIAVDFLDRALKQSGHETFLIVPDYGFSPEVPGVDLHRVKSLNIPKLQIAIALQDLEQERILGIVEGFQPDIIHSHHPFLLGDTALRAADEFGTPLVYTFHTLYEFFTHYVKLDFPRVRRKVLDFVRSYAESCDLVVTPTQPIHDYLVDLGIRRPIATVPTGIDATRFAGTTEQQLERLRHHYGLDRFDSVLLYVGRISREKDVQLCLEALDLLIGRGQNSCLLIFGEGPDESDLSRTSIERGLQDRVMLGGFLDQDSLAIAYSLGTVFLFPSASDTQGIVLYEALAAGLPVVATQSMASRAVIRSGVNGILCSAQPEAFADAVERVLAAPQAFTEPLPVAEYSATRIGEIYSDLYLHLAAGGRPRGAGKRKLLQELLDELRGGGRNQSPGIQRRSR